MHPPVLINGSEQRQQSKTTSHATKWKTMVRANVQLIITVIFQITLHYITIKIPTCPLQSCLLQCIFKMRQCVVSSVPNKHDHKELKGCQGLLQVSPALRWCAPGSSNHRIWIPPTSSKRCSPTHRSPGASTMKNPVSFVSHVSDTAFRAPFLLVLLLNPQGNLVAVWRKLSEE